MLAKLVTAILLFLFKIVRIYSEVIIFLVSGGACCDVEETPDLRKRGEHM